MFSPLYFLTKQPHQLSNRKAFGTVDDFLSRNESMFRYLQSLTVYPLRHACVPPLSLMPQPQPPEPCVHHFWIRLNPSQCVWPLWFFLISRRRTSNSIAILLDVGIYISASNISITTWGLCKCNIRFPFASM